VIETLRDLIAHNGYANAAILNAARQQDAAVADPEISDLLHHVLLANRFWLLTVLGLPFVVEDESRRSTSFDELIHGYHTTHEQQSAWLAKASDGDLARIMEGALIPGGHCSVAQAFVQVCLHSHGHRAQCARLLRRHDAAPPATDFITWLVNRSAPRW
jgi:uncharacterized damage-inducible protein DinB